MTIDGHELLDMRTIDLHSVCDTKHSAIIDELIMAKLCESDNKSAYSIKRGLLRGMHASEQLFTDIYKELL